MGKEFIGATLVPLMTAPDRPQSACTLSNAWMITGDQDGWVALVRWTRLEGQGGDAPEAVCNGVAKVGQG